jgi:hypothetical protein
MPQSGSHAVQPPTDAITTNPANYLGAWGKTRLPRCSKVISTAYFCCTHLPPLAEIAIPVRSH